MGVLRRFLVKMVVAGQKMAMKTFLMMIMGRRMMMMVEERKIWWWWWWWRRRWGWCRLIYRPGRKELLQNGADLSYKKHHHHHHFFNILIIKKIEFKIRFIWLTICCIQFDRIDTRTVDTSSYSRIYREMMLYKWFSLQWVCYCVFKSSLTCNT